MAHRALEHLLQYGEPPVRYVVLLRYCFGTAIVLPWYCQALAMRAGVHMSPGLLCLSAPLRRSKAVTELHAAVHPPLARCACCAGVPCRWRWRC